jgi:hypothetical protein
MELRRKTRGAQAPCRTGRVKFWIDELHTGLVVLPQRPRDAQLPLFSSAIAHILHRASQDQEAPDDWMLNRVVEVDEQSGECLDTLIPSC